jgi:hypothetical protein
MPQSTIPKLYTSARWLNGWRNMICAVEQHTLRHCCSETCSAVTRTNKRYLRSERVRGSALERGEEGRLVAPGRVQFEGKSKIGHLDEIRPLRSFILFWRVPVLDFRLSHTTQTPPPPHSTIKFSSFRSLCMMAGTDLCSQFSPRAASLAISNRWYRFKRLPSSLCHHTHTHTHTHGRPRRTH